MKRAGSEGTMNGLKHGHNCLGARSGVYTSWMTMLDRCRRKKNPAYPRYGGRGIGVCAAWLDFEQFLADMGERPEGLQLDRIDNSRGYEPGNCRWATPAEQARNRRNTKLDLWGVRFVRLWSERGYNDRDIASAFGVSRELVGAVRRGTRWAGV